MDQLEKIIKSKIESEEPNGLNTPFTLQGVKNCLAKRKRKATGKGDIQNSMLANLSEPNMVSVKYLFNVFIKNKFVSALWKLEIIIPLLKANKDPEDPSWYRPVSLTSCLCKAFERILSSRLHSFIESRNIFYPCKAGFRQGRSTSDHIVQLEHDVK